MEPGCLKGVRISQGLQSHRPPDSGVPQSVSLSGKTQSALNPSTSSSLEAGLGLPPVSIATVNRGPPAAVWGYRRYQYLQVHAGPGNPWDGAASSACPCLCMPVHRMHPQGWECMLLHKHMDTLACADTCTGTQALAGLTTNGMGDHPAGCDPLPQPPKSVLASWCREVLRRRDPT